MGNRKATVEAKKLFRRRVIDGWGYLVRKAKAEEGSPRDKKVEEARHTYWQGIGRAWQIYTEDNTMVKQVEETLDKAISQANRLYLQEDSNYNPKHFMQAMYHAHEEFADKVAPIFKAFMYDMKKYGRSR